MYYSEVNNFIFQKCYLMVMSCLPLESRIFYFQGYENEVGQILHWLATCWLTIESIEGMV